MSVKLVYGSAIFIATGTVNADIYIKECLQKRLLPFIAQHNKPVLFWPDLASSHYAKKTLIWYEANHVNFVAKSANPPNSPELRPIEQFWALVKQKLMKTGKTANNKKDFIRMWKNAASKIDSQIVKTMMEGVKRKVREFSRHLKLLTKKL